MDRTEQMAADIAVKLNGGEWSDGKWYSEGHREAWIKAVQPYADEIERLRKDYALAWENHLLHEQIFVLTEAKIERLQEALVEIVYQIGQGNNMAAMDIAAPIAAAYIQQKGG